MASYGDTTAVKTIFEVANRQKKAREVASNPENIYRRGRVNRVFTNSAELSKATIDPNKFKKINPGFAAGIIEFYPANEFNPKERTELAQPIDTHFTPAIAHNDMIEYTTVDNINYYRGPINTNNDPTFSPDTGISKLFTNATKKAINMDSPGKQKVERELFAQQMSTVKQLFQKSGKVKKPEIEDALKPNPINGWARELFGMGSSDMIFEGRKGNSIRLGQDGEFPNVKIANNSNGLEEKLTDGSLIAMTTNGNLKQNFPSDTAFKLSCDSGENEGKGPEMASGNTEGQFDYEYATVQPDIQQQEQFNQMIMQSDRIILDSQDEDVTVSSNRHINIGAGKNMSITNKGYTVLESKNIYIGNKAKERTQPMVLGTELQKALIEIIDFIGTLAYTAPASGLGPGTPCFSGTTPLAAAISQLKRGLGLDTEFEPSGEPESLEAETPKSTFLSSKHFIEPNQE